MGTVADPQNLLEEKEALEEKLAISDYEFRLAQEDILKLKSELQKNVENTLDENGRPWFWFMSGLLFFILKCAWLSLYNFQCELSVLYCLPG